MNNLLTKIRQLLAHAESAEKIGSQAEAEAFAAKANKLMLEHKLQMADVERFGDEDEDPMGHEQYDASSVDGIPNGKRLQWLERLMAHLCKAHFCEFIVFPGTRQYRVIGREADRQITLYLFDVLASTAERLSLAHYHEVHKKWRDNGSIPREKPYRAQRSFRLGFAEAIVVFNDAAVATKEYMNDNFRTSRASGLNNSYDKRSHGAGYAAGQKANLNTGIGGGTARAGSNLLGRGN